MSEPDAGSDPAALETRAELQGDSFVIRGQKTWTSFASQADYCYLVARTDPQARPHRGISEILVPMDAAGIEVRPIRDMVGETHFAEVFFDGVRVPRANLIGELHRGWYQIMQQLDYERSGIERLISNGPLWSDFKIWARERGLTRDPVLRDEIAQIEIARFAGRQLIYHVAALLSEGKVPGREAAAAKAVCTEIEQRIANLVTRALGAAGLLAPGAPGAPLGGRAARNLLYAPAYTIQGGTNNILRNIVATRVLGLPGR
jgi:alkylation response protein AidB-like acyl-CoA dehydrogenase